MPLDEVEPVGFAVVLPPGAVVCRAGWVRSRRIRRACIRLVLDRHDGLLVGSLGALDSAPVWALSLGSGSGTVKLELLHECLPSGR